MPDSFSFTLTREQQKSVDRRTARQRGPSTVSVLWLWFGGQLSNAGVFFSEHPRSSSFVIGGCIVGAVALVAVGRLRKLPYPEGRVDVETGGLRLSSEGNVERLAWRDLTMASDLGDVFVIFRTAGRLLAVPKTAFDDGGAAFWSLLDEHLTAKKNLVVPQGVARRLLVNTARAAAKPRAPSPLAFPFR